MVEEMGGLEEISWKKGVGRAGQGRNNSHGLPLNVQSAFSVDIFHA